MKTREIVLAFDFGGTKMAIATADRSGQLLRQVTLPTLAESGADQALERAIESGRALVAETEGDGATLVGVGVSTMGVTLENSVLMAPNVPGWERQTIPRRMRQAFATEAVRLANDVKAAARAEVRWGSLSGIDTGIYVNLGTGIAAALISGGAPLEGAHGAAGEIAYNLRHLRQQQGARDGHAPLEEFVGGGAISARIRDRFGKDATPQSVFADAEVSVEAGAFVEETLEELSFHLTNLAIAFDPSRIVVAGGLMRSPVRLLQRLRAYADRFVPFPPEIVAGRFLLDGGLVGGIVLGLEAADGLR